MSPSKGWGSGGVRQIQIIPKVDTLNPCEKAWGSFSTLQGRRCEQPVRYPVRGSVCYTRMSNERPDRGGHTQ